MKHTFLRALCLLCAILLMGALCLTGCGSEEPAADEQVPTTQQTHHHDKPTALDVSYTDEADGTITCTVKDCQGNPLFTKTGLKTKGFTEAISDSVFSLSWVINSNPGGYESVYFDRVNCRASAVIVGEQATDGVRIVYPEMKDGVLNVIVRDLFDEKVYSKTYPIDDAYTAGDYTVLGAKMKDETHANMSYLVDKDGTNRTITFNLYEDKADQSSTKATETTAKK